ncbi:hypothetical protein AYO40_04505 [Planctomycetaceae bacterium SCGC AG-212-D15]|nr:hypothetical protein AYO40_04505 [Planctomycetaceae bacterium SCGC AG-212-D15]
MECRGRTFDDERLNELLPRLEKASEVSLVRSAVSDEGMKILAKLPLLRSLLISGGDSITDKGVSYLRKAVNLRELYLRETRITDKALTHVGKLPSVWSLILDDTAVTDVGCQRLANMDSLSLLGLSGTKVEGWGLDALPNNEYFNLCWERSAATDAGVIAAVRRLTKLKDLNLSDTAVSDQALAAIAKLRHLDAVRLSNTRITDAGLAAFQGHPKLVTIYLRGCNISSAAVEKLKEKTPKLMFVYWP